MIRIFGFILLLSVGGFAQGRDPLAGAWEQTAAKNLTTNTDQQLASPFLHVIFSNGQYVQFRAAANRPKIQTPPAEMTKEQMLQRYNGTQGQYGTYRVDGNKLNRKIISAANPNNEGVDATSDFRIEGDTLIITRTNPQGQKIEDRYRRLRQGS